MPQTRFPSSSVPVHGSSASPRDYCKKLPETPSACGGLHIRDSVHQSSPELCARVADVCLPSTETSTGQARSHACKGSSFLELVDEPVQLLQGSFPLTSLPSMSLVRRIILRLGSALTRSLNPRTVGSSGAIPTHKRSHALHNASGMPGLPATPQRQFGACPHGQHHSHDLHDPAVPCSAVQQALPGSSEPLNCCIRNAVTFWECRTA